MSCKAGNRSHKDGCIKYKNENRREKNKAIRAERNERRIARFARRSENNKQTNDYVPKDPETRGTNHQEPMGDFAWRPRMEHMTEYQRTQSFLRRIQNQLDAEAKEMKQEEQKKKNNKKEGKND